jgi:hypothetical protein
LQNPFCLYADPSASKDPLKRDADRIGSLTDKHFSKAAYEKRWPDAEKSSSSPNRTSSMTTMTGQTDESYRIVEYWYKEPYEKEIWQMHDGKVIDSGV